MVVPSPTIIVKPWSNRLAMCREPRSPGCAILGPHIEGYGGGQGAHDATNLQVTTVAEFTDC